MNEYLKIKTELKNKLDIMNEVENQDIKATLYKDAIKLKEQLIEIRKRKQEV